MNELILIVDDEPGILETLSGILTDEGYRTLTTPSGDEALTLYEAEKPDVVFLDIWLPDKDGLETLQAIKELDSNAAVIMMSGHGTSATAVKSIKMGAHNYLEKPLSYDSAVNAVVSALESKSAQAAAGTTSILELGLDRLDTERTFNAPPLLPQVQEGSQPQRTIAHSIVIYGLGLHSGSQTGMVIQPLPPDSGIHLSTLPGGNHIPAHLDFVAQTDYATTLTSGGDHIRTVEHLLSSLHATGITNLLVKVHGEIPVLDGSALEFCRYLLDVGIVDQGVPRREVVIDRTYRIEEGNKSLVVEPFDGLAVSYFLDYPAPVGQQQVDFTMTDFESYMDQVAPARTFGFMRDMKMINELGLGSGGRLDNFILVGEDNVLNTDLRFPDEFARHKILDIIGDMYLMGYPLRGKITARLTGHRDNVAVQRLIAKQD
jgi:UDP-3-O-[3-hydroxymyristoyl] N-acetylglucosamine deacetylase